MFRPSVKAVYLSQTNIMMDIATESGEEVEASPCPKSLTSEIKPLNECNSKFELNFSV